MSNSELGFAGRLVELHPIITEVFDLPYVTRIALGRHWAALSLKQRAIMVDTFTRLTVATYAARFDTYSGERFVIANQRALKSDRIMIDCELQRANEDPVHLQYMLHVAGEQWRIINVIANGVSDLALKRATYSAVVEDQGFDALLKRLETKIEALAQPRKSDYVETTAPG
jgi:phospholipid transport system substrate-binding protein